MDHDSLIDKEDKIYEALYEEYINSYSSDWSEFLESNEYGIRVNSKQYMAYGAVLYEIVDANRWMLTKIKYGIV